MFQNTLPPPLNTNFSCRSRTTGFYADLETNCRVYHTCDDQGNKFTYHCPEETAFRQDALICDHAHLVDCQQGTRVSTLSTENSKQNLHLGPTVSPTPKSPPGDGQPRPDHRISPGVRKQESPPTTQRPGQGERISSDNRRNFDSTTSRSTVNEGPAFRSARTFDPTSGRLNFEDRPGAKGSRTFGPASEKAVRSDHPGSTNPRTFDFTTSRSVLNERPAFDSLGRFESSERGQETRKNLRNIQSSQVASPSAKLASFGRGKSQVEGTGGGPGSPFPDFRDRFKGLGTLQPPFPQPRSFGSSGGRTLDGYQTKSPGHDRHGGNDNTSLNVDSRTSGWRAFDGYQIRSPGNDKNGEHNVSSNAESRSTGWRAFDGYQTRSPGHDGHGGNDNTSLNVDSRTTGWRAFDGYQIRSPGNEKNGANNASSDAESRTTGWRAFDGYQTKSQGNEKNGANNKVPSIVSSSFEGSRGERRTFEDSHDRGSSSRKVKFDNTKTAFERTTVSSRPFSTFSDFSKSSIRSQAGNYPYSETLRSIQFPGSSTTANVVTTMAPVIPRRPSRVNVGTTETPVAAFTASLKPLVPNELEIDPYYPKSSSSTEAYYTPREGSKDLTPIRFSTVKPFSSSKLDIPAVLPDLNSLEDIVDRRKLFYIPKVKSR
ncbi:uncharacterized protein LOC105703567 [Orussus abietinus]|uniref:uncharacterized protein LOC105703567 n=1 Tax=Orussus abietinus TaxID=222816 RepID=UPI0006260DD0|nr:uncharacterized protein LOC105703567 [Orussus abietinus]